MRVIGIDCGSERTGYGVIDTDGHTHVLVTAGTITTLPRDPMGTRLRVIAEGLRNIIATHAPECGAVEEVFHAANAQSALKLAQVRGVALLVAAEAGLVMGEYSALVIKKTVVGHGHAAKEQVQYMMRSMLGPEAPAHLPDACDALAVSICHATHLQLQSRRMPA